ncbi:uncharacterized protein N7459_002253 [Penicillium hispanicum]|uniref:uncharacterized protein n=1 Tax=Penicillium hispanicum TaxID=1080232 RepID=UPI00253F6BA6|nr:uncharacterized protein N7459_002253 [Penicillium hispanicum]KAJ5591884.1 hypothetical protein N7459_002253 [Penicillium hispanicum]
MAPQKLTLASVWALEDLGVRELGDQIQAANTDARVLYLKPSHVFTIKGIIDWESEILYAKLIESYIESNRRPNLFDTPCLRRLVTVGIGQNMPPPGHSGDLRSPPRVSNRDKYSHQDAAFESWTPSSDSFRYFEKDTHGIVREIAAATGTRIAVDRFSGRGSGQINISGLLFEDVDEAISKLETLEKPMGFVESPYRAFVFMGEDKRLRAFSLPRYGDLGPIAVRRLLVEPSTDMDVEISCMHMPVCFDYNKEENHRGYHMPSCLRDPKMVPETSKDTHFWEEAFSTFPEIGNGEAYSEIPIFSLPDPDAEVQSTPLPLPRVLSQSNFSSKPPSNPRSNPWSNPSSTSQSPAPHARRPSLFLSTEKNRELNKWNQSVRSGTPETSSPISASVGTDEEDAANQSPTDSDSKTSGSFAIQQTAGARRRVKPLLLTRKALPVDNPPNEIEGTPETAPISGVSTAPKPSPSDTQAFSPSSQLVAGPTDPSSSGTAVPSPLGTVTAASSPIKDENVCPVGQVPEEDPINTKTGIFIDVTDDVGITSAGSVNITTKAEAKMAPQKEISTPLDKCRVDNTTSTPSSAPPLMTFRDTLPRSTAAGNVQSWGPEFSVDDEPDLSPPGGVSLLGTSVESISKKKDVSSKEHSSPPAVQSAVSSTPGFHAKSSSNTQTARRPVAPGLKWTTSRQESPAIKTPPDAKDESAFVLPSPKSPHRTTKLPHGHKTLLSTKDDPAVEASSPRRPRLVIKLPTGNEESPNISYRPAYRSTAQSAPGLESPQHPKVPSGLDLPESTIFGSMEHPSCSPVASKTQLPDLELRVPKTKAVRTSLLDSLEKEPGRTQRKGKERQRFVVPKESKNSSQDSVVPRVPIGKLIDLDDDDDIKETLAPTDETQSRQFHSTMNQKASRPPYMENEITRPVSEEPPEGSFSPENPFSRGSIAENFLTKILEKELETATGKEQDSSVISGVSEGLPRTWVTVHEPIGPLIDFDDDVADDLVTKNEAPSLDFHATTKQETPSPSSKEKGNAGSGAAIPPSWDAAITEPWSMSKAQASNSRDQEDRTPRSRIPSPEEQQKIAASSHEHTKTLFHQMEPLLNAIKSYPGSLNLEIQLGLALVPHIPQSCNPTRGKFWDYHAIRRLFQPHSGVRPPSCAFFNRLTTSLSDVDHLLSVHCNGLRLFEEQFTTRDVRYEFHCETNTGDTLIITVSECGEHTLSAPANRLGSVCLIFPDNVWDAAVIIHGNMGHEMVLNSQTQEAAQHVVSNLWVQPHRSQVRLLTRCQNNTLEIKKVFMKRSTQHQWLGDTPGGSGDGRMCLRITEVQDLFVAASPGDKEVIEACCAPPADMVKHQRQWWEAALVSPAVDAVLKTNACLKLGESASDWCPEDLLGRDGSSNSLVARAIGPAGIGGLLRLAETVVKNIDAVGYHNSGPVVDQVHIGRRNAISSDTTSISQQEEPKLAEPVPEVSAGAAVITKKPDRQSEEKPVSSLAFW